METALPDLAGGPPSAWGAKAWRWLHLLAINYSESPTRAEQLRTFLLFWSFCQTLPCPTCRAHATAYARRHPPDFSGSAGFQTWAWRFHNATNLRLGKPALTAEAYRVLYQADLAWRYKDYL
jgi:FAD-linked sulfhydryl oxidase